MPEVERVNNLPGFQETLAEYREEFGDDPVSLFHVYAAERVEPVRDILREMRWGLDGDRDALTEEALGLDVPAGAVN